MNDMPRHPLDNPAWASLHSSHAHFAEIRGEAARFQPDVAPFAAVADSPTSRCWHDLESLLGAGTTAVLVDVPDDAPPNWTMLDQVRGVQLTGEGLEVRDDPDAVELGAADVPDMLDLVSRTKPGPFLPRTVEMGRYLGIRVDGELVAMAGERLQPPGWTEVSAVCTDERFRGRGFATRLIRAVGAGIRARGDVPFLHAAAHNAGAITLYESLGFTLRRGRVFTAWKLPD
jgi:ribosomal protein S18 acetylase RimI-like enzyme